jgi:hypothetical protein
MLLLLRQQLRQLGSNARQRRHSLEGQGQTQACARHNPTHDACRTHAQWQLVSRIACQQPPQLLLCQGWLQLLLAWLRQQWQAATQGLQVRECCGCSCGRRDGYPCGL